MKKSQTELWQKLGGLIDRMSEKELQKMGFHIFNRNGKFTNKDLKKMVDELEASVMNREMKRLF